MTRPLANAPYTATTTLGLFVTATKDLMLRILKLLTSLDTLPQLTATAMSCQVDHALQPKLPPKYQEFNYL